MEHLQVAIYLEDGCDYKNNKMQHTLGFLWWSPTFSCFTISHYSLIKKNLEWIKGERGKRWTCPILYPISAVREERSLVLWLYFLSWSQIWFTQRCFSIVQGVKEELNYIAIWLYRVLHCHGGIELFLWYWGVDTSTFKSAIDLISTRAGH